jgi:hypothetical protein
MRYLIGASYMKPRSPPRNVKRFAKAIRGKSPQNAGRRSLLAGCNNYFIRG